VADVKKVVKKKKSSVVKRARQAVIRKQKNSAVKSKMRKVVRRAKTEGLKPESLSGAYTEIDRAAKKGAIHKRTAARYKSRLARASAKKK
jgi:small subunit ribosomal protein S20